MRSNRSAITALAASGVLWGVAVPLSKLALGWLGPAWLAVARFSIAAPVLALIGRRGLRQAITPSVLASGAVGFGAVIVLQNLGLERTSVSHAAVVVGAVPVIVALLALRTGASPGTSGWSGYGIALAGVALVAGGGGAGASHAGDLLVLASASLSALFIAVQPRLLDGRDAAAVTSVQFAGGGLAMLPIALLTESAPTTDAHGTAAAAFMALALVGTILPFWLFAFGQARVPAEVAGAWVNLEPVVGAGVGWLAFGNSAALGQILGAAAVIAGIILSTMPAPGSVSDVAAALGRFAQRRHGFAERYTPFQV
jgi:drug/metabolite transporter (DMT)-like permease